VHVISGSYSGKDYLDDLQPLGVGLEFDAIVVKGKIEILDTNFFEADLPMGCKRFQNFLETDAHKRILAVVILNFQFGDTCVSSRDVSD
jgi:hypothetical protein